MDAIDRKILAELQHDGRLTITELAEKIGLSVSPCHDDYANWNAAASSSATEPSWTPPPSD